MQNGLVMSPRYTLIGKHLKQINETLAALELQRNDKPLPDGWWDGKRLYARTTLSCLEIDQLTLSWASSTRANRIRLLHGPLPSSRGPPIHSPPRALRQA